MESWGFLLLGSHLGNPDRKPLTTAQLRGLAQRIRAHGPFEQEGELSAQDLIHMGYSREMAGHILSLLGDQALLHRYLQKGRARRCVPLTRQCDRYPMQLRRRLGLDSPGCLWAKGDLSLLDGKLVSLVGCRSLMEDNRRFALRAGEEAAWQGYTLVSGNAVGADQTAQRACLDAGGKVICVVADALHSHLERPNVLYLSEEDYDAPFSSLRALRRNRVIHALGEGVLVAQCRDGKGGTWSGTSQNLRAHWTGVCCYDDGSDGAKALVSLGAVPVGTGDLSDLPGLFKREKTLFDLEDC